MATLPMTLTAAGLALEAAAKVNNTNPVLDSYSGWARAVHARWDRNCPYDTVQPREASN